MFLTIVACVVDDVRAFNNKGVLATILLALAMLAVSLASLFTIVSCLICEIILIKIISGSYCARSGLLARLPRHHTLRHRRCTLLR